VTETASLIIGVDSTQAKRATKDLDALTKQSKQSEGAVAGLGKAFLALGGAYAIGAGIRKIINATIESEKAQAQLAAALKSTGREAQITQGQLNAYAAEMQRLTVFDDEAVAGAQSLLLTFEHLGVDMLPRVTRATADVAQALGKDLSGAAEAVGKALDSPLDASRALLGLNVRLTDSQESLIKRFMETGETAKAQGVILEELERRYEGSAEAAKNTLGGALQGLKNDFDNLLEGEGSGIVGATSAINDLGEVMRSPGVKDGFAAVIQGLANIASFSVEAIAMIGGVGESLNQRFKLAKDKSYQGLLEERARLDGRLKRAQDGAMWGTAISGDPVKIQAEIDALDDLIAVRRSLAALPSPQDFANRGTLLNDTVTITGDGVTPNGGGGGATANFERVIELGKRANEGATDFMRTLEDLRAQLEGPIAEVNLEYARRQEEITLQYQDSKAGADALAEALGLLEQQRLAEVAALQAQTVATKDYEKVITDAQAMQQGAMDMFKDSFARNVEDVMTGAESIGDAFRNLADSVIAQIARMLAQKWTEQLFGQGTGGGDLLGSIFGVFTGGGGNIASGINNFSSLAGVTKSFSKFATGTDFAPGGMAWVGERGPELVNLPRGSQVIPADKSARMGGNTITINIAGHATKETAQQIASKVAQQMAFAGRAR